ncbi:hypothetical protein FA13DRAFT_1685867 [Coprinellus micaceus]|uniref:RING-CH-type domain-containing protein n=1 Tax=Coprinellus micaceus TaxID=71717 RepID=A0A4Y7THY0_COPMI|nr:hypothetical protein FA13DRAFT_1685867 [Coprinellus micaceus]
MATTSKAPTIDDLRVKLCYICREEELHGAPLENPPRRWTHPCKCTLVAHEQCLLKWIQSAQASQGRAPNALKCPQCGVNYELESNNPPVLRLMEVGNKMIQKAGSLFIVFGAATVAGVIGTSVYVVMTGYGAWAVQKFIGKEMFDLLLGDDPSNWPWSAYLNLPILPLSLIFNRLGMTSTVYPIYPILLTLPSSSPSLNRRVNEYWRLPENARRIIDGIVSTRPAVVDSSSPSSWPPSPFLFGLFGVPLIQWLYRRMYKQVYFKVMGSMPPERTNLMRRNRNRNGNGGNGGGGQQGNREANANGVRRNNVRRMNIGDGPFGIRVQANIREEVIDMPPNDAEVENQVQDAVAAAERLAEGVPDDEDEVISISASTIGRKIAGALVTPAIASWAGNLLLRFTQRTRSVWLREFLAIKKPIGAIWMPPPVDLGNRDMHTLGTFRQIVVGVQMIAKGLWGSTRTWAESDPVWWRNTVGLGLFIAAKDCVHLFHLWLSKRELESRKVKSLDFSAVDIRELDLLPSFPRLAGP